VLASVVLSLLCGGVGAWSYETYFKHYFNTHEAGAKPEAVAANPSPAPAPSQAPSDEAVKNLDQKLGSFQKTVQDRVDRLEEQIGMIPKNQPAIDLKSLKDRVTELEKHASDTSSIAALDDRISAIERKVIDAPSAKSLDDRVKAMEVKLGSSKTEVDGSSSSNKPAATGSSDTPSSPAITRRDSARPATVDVNVGADAFAEGSALFDKRDYTGALKVFQSLQADRPEDARVWYFSALARGFTTGDWRGETERLVQKGVEREKAGTPSPSLIDAAFINLTRNTGKDWLSFYRQQAKR
jgi:hypothetical protein